VSVVANEAPSGGALFTTFLEAVPDALIAVDGRGSIVLVNTQAEALFGYRREELIGLPVEPSMWRPESSAATAISPRGVVPKRSSRSERTAGSSISCSPMW
jgi:PAS domain S-box-containing protein